MMSFVFSIESGKDDEYLKSEQFFYILTEKYAGE